MPTSHLMYIDELMSNISPKSQLGLHRNRMKYFIKLLMRNEQFRLPLLVGKTNDISFTFMLQHKQLILTGGE